MMIRDKAKILGASVVGAAGVSAAALVLPQAFAGNTTTFKSRVYELTYRLRGDAPIRVYASLTTGSWREEMRDEIRISNGKSYDMISRETGDIYHRAGGARFMGFLTDSPAPVTAAATYLAGRTRLSSRTFALNGAGAPRLDVAHRSGKVELRVLQSGRTVFTVRIDRRISDQMAAKMKLFVAQPGNVSDVQLAVGQAPTVPVRAYWFGRAIAGKPALAAAQHERHRSAEEIKGGMNQRGESEIQVTLYENPGVTAASTEPGVGERPAGELQVTNEPVDSAHAQAFIAALNGRNGDETYAPWPRTTMKLADGETVDVVPDRFDADNGSQTTTGFSVITTTTLVHIAGSIPLAAVPDLVARLVRLR